MSGLLTSRVNCNWTKAQANISAAVFFWDMLHFFNDHPSMICRGYGTDKVQSGTTLPLAWLSWNPAVDAVPIGNNSWAVFEATNASELLVGAGTFPWQFKIQMTLATGFDDCNVADIDYQQETQTYCVCMRASAMGGWTGGAVCDFQPTAGEDTSNNILVFQGQEENYFFDIVGDDDAVVWKGSAYNTTEYLQQSRSGYIGMLQRRSSDITYPFIFFAGRIYNIGASAGQSALNSHNIASANNQWQYTNSAMQWPSYSLWLDGTKVSAHHVDTWSHLNIPRITPDQATGNDLILNMLISQRETSPIHHAIIGELLLLTATGISYAQHVVFGTATERWIQICYEAPSFCGVGMRWPVGVVPIW